VTERDHKGIAARESQPQPRRDHPAAPIGRLGSPRHALCATCGDPIHYRKRTYGPNGRKGGWSHTGDGLVQFRAWGVGR
jgi:hypothetical protein